MHNNYVVVFIGIKDDFKYDIIKDRIANLLELDKWEYSGSITYEMFDHNTHDDEIRNIAEEASNVKVYFIYIDHDTEFMTLSDPAKGKFSVINTEKLESIRKSIQWYNAKVIKRNRAGELPMCKRVYAFDATLIEGSTQLMLEAIDGLVDDIMKQIDLRSKEEKIDYYFDHFMKPMADEYARRYLKPKPNNTREILLQMRRQQEFSYPMETINPDRYKYLPDRGAILDKQTNRLMPIETFNDLKKAPKI